MPHLIKAIMAIVSSAKMLMENPREQIDQESRDVINGLSETQIDTLAGLGSSYQFALESGVDADAVNDIFSSAVTQWQQDKSLKVSENFFSKEGKDDWNIATLFEEFPLVEFVETKAVDIENELNSVAEEMKRRSLELAGTEFLIDSTGYGLTPFITLNNGDTIYTRLDGNKITMTIVELDGNIQIAKKTVNTENAGDVKSPQITKLAEGYFVITWEGRDGAWTSDGVIYAKIYDSNDLEINSSFLATTPRHNSNSPKQPVITGLNDGGFVISWHKKEQDNSWDVYYQVYNSDGTVRESEKRCNQSVEGQQTLPSVTSLSNGGFAISWYSLNKDSFLRIFDRLGVAQTGDIKITNDTKVGNPKVAGLDNGTFVSAMSYRDGKIYAQMFDNDGARIGEQFPVSSATMVYEQNNQVVKKLADGGFFVAWDGHIIGKNDGDGMEVYGQRFSANGGRMGNEIILSTNVAGNQYSPQIAATNSGGFIATWASDGNGIVAQRFDSNNTKIKMDVEPTIQNTETPTISPTYITLNPTGQPSFSTQAPSTLNPTNNPTFEITPSPTDAQITLTPTSNQPTKLPTITIAPSDSPTKQPTVAVIDNSTNPPTSGEFTLNPTTNPPTLSPTNSEDQTAYNATILGLSIASVVILTVAALGCYKRREIKDVINRARGGRIEDHSDQNQIELVNLSTPGSSPVHPISRGQVNVGQTMENDLTIV